MSPTDHRPARHVDDAERRRRLALRHALAPAARVADPVAATRAMTVLHATELASIHLAVHARVDGVRVADVERALYDDRSLVIQLAMRRTLFVFPRDLLPAAVGACGRRLVGQYGARLAKEVVEAGLTADGDAWLAEASAAVVDLLADGRPRGSREIKAAVPMIGSTVIRSPGTKWGGTFAVAPQLFTVLHAEGLIVRGANSGHWRLSKPTWTTSRAWLGEDLDLPDARTGYAELVRRWLATFGPGTERDLAWWLGGTLGAVRTALADVEAVPVSLDGGATGWLLPDDLEEPGEVEPWVALLPTLDPTVMGWKERDFYLGPHGPALFDAVGNGGTTAWVDGRVVGCWVQDFAHGNAVRVHLVEEVSAAARRRLDAEAERLTAWLAGERVTTIWVSPAMRAAAALG